MHSTGVDLGAIKHLPSNRDMVARVSRTIRSFSAQKLSAMGQVPTQVRWSGMCVCMGMRVNVRVFVIGRVCGWAPLQLAGACNQRYPWL